MAQRLYLLVSAVLMIVVSQSRLATFVARENGFEYALSCMNLSSVADESIVLSSAPWALMVLAIILVLLSLFTLFLVFYQNYALQKRMTIYNMLISLGFILTYLVFFFYYDGKLEAIKSEMTLWAIAIPAVVFILQLMSFWAIRKKEASVLFDASSFRLRD